MTWPTRCSNAAISTTTPAGGSWKTSDLHKDPGSTYSDAVTTIARYKTGHVYTVTDARSDVTTYGYDNAWRRTSVEDEMGNTWTWTLDDNGNATAWDIEEVHSGGTVTHEYEATYDVLNRRTQLQRDRPHQRQQRAGDRLRLRLALQPGVEGQRRGQPDALDV